MYSCRWCATALPEPVLDLGTQPAADDFPLPPEGAQAMRYPLQLAICPACELAQLVDDPTVPDEPRAVEPLALVEQARDAVARITAAGLLPAGVGFAEFDSPHGGSWREILSAQGAVDAGDGPGDVVVDVFSMMHDADQRVALRRRVDKLAAQGTLLLQFHPFPTIVELGQWNALRHGHMAYYSVTALVGMLAELGLSPVTAWSFGLYGRTILLAARRGGQPDEVITGLLAQERSAGVGQAGYGRSLQDSLAQSVAALGTWLDEQAQARLRVGGYAAASRAVPLLNAAQIGPDRLAWIADGSQAKWGRTLPGVAVPIVSPTVLHDDPPERVLLFLPDLLAEVRAAYPQVEASGGRWVIAEPVPRLVEPITSV